MYLDLDEQWDGINMKNIFRKILGLDRLEEEKEQLEKERAESLARAAEA